MVIVLCSGEGPGRRRGVEARPRQIGEAVLNVSFCDAEVVFSSGP